MNAYEFIVKLKDMASSQLKQIASSLGITKTNADGVNNSMKNIEKTSSNLNGSLGKLKSLIVSVFAVATIFSFTNKVIDARAEYEKFNAVLANTFQSDKIGAAALNMLTDFATKTPFQLNDLTGSFVKLVNRGFAPTMDEMTKLGDLASSQGKGFDQLTEAMLDAQTGEFERLKEFGIKASKSGDKVTLSFKGVTKEVKNNSDAIGEALMQYGKMTGVAGSMEAISKTLGGKISNLGDQWNNFLVAVGGESGGIFTGVISMLSMGLAFLTDNLGNISMYFSMLWDVISPLIFATKDWIRETLGISSASTAIETFKNIMASILGVVDLVVTGAMSPLGQAILSVVGVVVKFYVAFSILNFVMSMNPISLIIIGIIALIGIIGLVSKYTYGFGESWKHTVTGAKLLWQAFKEDAAAKFNTLVNGFMIGINKIKLGWYEFKESLGMGDSGENQKMMAQINADTEKRKKAIIDDNTNSMNTAKKAAAEFSKISFGFDTNGFSKDIKDIKSKFSGDLGKKDTGTSAYDDYLAKQKGTLAGSKGKADDKTSDKKDNIVSGGSKITHIAINIQKLQDDTKIFVDSAEKGINNLGEKVQEMLLRAVNSVNQMQTD